MPWIMDEFAFNQQFFSQNSHMIEKPQEPFYQVKLSTSGAVSFPRETSELAKTVAAVPERAI